MGLIMGGCAKQNSPSKSTESAKIAQVSKKIPNYLQDDLELVRRRNETAVNADTMKLENAADRIFQKEILDGLTRAKIIGLFGQPNNMYLDVAGNVDGSKPLIYHIGTFGRVKAYKLYFVETIDRIDTGWFDL